MKLTIRLFMTLALVVLLPLYPSKSRAGEVVAVDSGDTSSGSLRQVLGAAPGGTTITFDDSISRIELFGPAKSTRQGITITGPASGFGGGVAGFLGGYGIKRGQPADFSSFGADTFAIGSLSSSVAILPMPGIVLDGGGNTRIMEFTSTSTFASQTIAGLSFQNAYHSILAPDDDVSGDPLWDDNSAESSAGLKPGASFKIMDNAKGGALSILGAGDVSFSSFTGNILSAKSGSALAGEAEDNIYDSPAYAYGIATALALSGAAGGGVSLGDYSTITTSLFYKNKALAEAGAAIANTATSIAEDDSFWAEAEADADAFAIARAQTEGGGAVIGKLGEITESLFVENATLAKGGTAVGGDAVAITEFDDPDGVSNLSFSVFADSSATASGGGLAASSPTVSASMFAGNTVVAQAGNATAGSITATVPAAMDDSQSSLEADAHAHAMSTAMGGGLAVTSGAIEMESSLFLGNSATARGGTATGATINSDFSQVLFRVEIDMDVSADARARGGAVYSSGTKLSSSLFSGNQASAFAGNTTVGTSPQAEAFGNASSATAFAEGGALYTTFAEIEASLFTGNKAVAHGGYGVSALGTAAADAQATGGAVHATSGIIKNSEFSRNTAQATAGTISNSLYGAESMGWAMGGAVYSSQGLEITSSSINNNTLAAFGGSATVSDSYEFAIANSIAIASGGGAYMGRSSIIDTSLISGNSVRAVGGAKAHGATASDYLIPSGTPLFSWATADAYAFGGGVFLHSMQLESDPLGRNVIKDSSIINNSVTAEANGVVLQNGVLVQPEAKAQGGGVFVNTGWLRERLGSDYYSTKPSLHVEASAGNTVIIAGNTANGKASGIHFGSGILSLFSTSGATGYLAESVGTAELSLKADGNIIMTDPISVSMYNSSAAGAAFRADVQSGAGTLVWGGRNILDANGGSTVSFNSGSNTFLAADFSLAATPGVTYRTGSASDAYARETHEDYNKNDLTVVIETGANIIFDPARNVDVAMFDLATSTSAGVAGNFSAGTVAFGIAENYYDRHIRSVAPANYLVATGLSNDDRDAAGLFAGYGITGFDKSQNGKILLTSKGYASPWQGAIDDWRNLDNSAEALQLLMSDRNLISDSLFAAVMRDHNSTTPDHVLNRADAALFAAKFVAENARSMAFAPYVSATPYEPGTFGSAVPRFWGGYVGSFAQNDSHGRQRGYNQRVHTGIVGVNWDYAAASAGFYAAHTNEKTDVHRSSAEVDSTGSHFGTLGRIAPIATLPGFTVNADVAFSHFSNTGKRRVANNSIHADFNQNIYSGGIGAEYAQAFGDTSLATFANLRHSRLYQDDVTETGGLTATKTRDINAQRTTSELGVESALNFTSQSLLASLYLNTSWSHEFGTRDFGTRSNFIMPSGHAAAALPDTFTLRSVKQARDSANIGTGIRLRATREDELQFYLNVGYRGNFAKDRKAQSVSASLELQF